MRGESATSSSTQPGPLAGVRIVEFCQIAAGPFCAMLLADQGADVIKVEAPGGDGMRQWPPLSNGFSENFASVNRNKRSIVLDLKSEDGRRTAQDLCLGADVVIENFRPGVMARLGLSYADLSPRAPKLVYCSISAFGQRGPRAQEGGFDVTLQAVGGVMSVTGEAGGDPVKCGVPLTDFSAGLYGAFGIASALHAVRAGALGRYIDVPMLGTTLGIAALQTSQYFGTGQDPEKLGSAHPRNAPYQAFCCRGGHVVMAAGTDDLFRRACASVGLHAVAADARFATTRLRADNQKALAALFEEAFASRSSAECLEALRAAGVPCAPINTYSQAIDDAQVAHYGWVQALELPNGVVTRTFTDPLGVGTAIRRPPPALGEHTDEILQELRNAQSGQATGVR